MYRLGIHLKRLILVAGDVALYQIALVLTLWLRYGHFATSDWRLHIIPFTIVNFLWVLGAYIAGLYDLQTAQNTIKFLRMYLEGMIANLAVALAFFYLVPIFNIEPRTNLFLYFAIALLIGYSWRLIFNRYIAKAIFKNRIIFVGSPADAAKVRTLISDTPFGFELVAVMETGEGERFDDAGITWHSSLHTLESVLKEQRIQTILLGHRPDDVPGLRDALYKTIFTPVGLLDRTALEETMTGRVPLEYVSQTWFLEHLRENEKKGYEGAKRVTDIIAAIPIGLVTLVLFPFIALAIKLNSSGPLLIRQTRIGKMGQTFTLYKFRSMVDNAEVLGKPQYASKDDPRITKVGKFLRKSRLDELPQIWNVLRSDMSLVGPRPERPEFVEQLTAQMPFYALRHLTKPGCTGWAQIKFPYAGTLEDNLKKLQYDLFYIKHRSLMLDVAVLLKTIGIMLRRQGT